MPRYRFTIRSTDHFDDEDGMILPDDRTAREHAIKSWMNYRKKTRQVGLITQWRWCGRDGLYGGSHSTALRFQRRCDTKTKEASQISCYLLTALAGKALASDAGGVAGAVSETHRLGYG
jgi:hypothetical protein